MLFELKEMTKNVKQNAVKSHDSVGFVNVFLNKSLFFSNIYTNKLWTVVDRNENINKLGEIYKNLFQKVVQDFCFSIIKSSQSTMLWNLYASDEAFPLGYWTQSFSLSKCWLNINTLSCSYWSVQRV